MIKKRDLLRMLYIKFIGIKNGKEYYKNLNTGEVYECSNYIAKLINNNPIVVL